MVLVCSSRRRSPRVVPSLNLTPHSHYDCWHCSRKRCIRAPRKRSYSQNQPVPLNCSMALRIKSLAVAAPSIEQLCHKFAAKLKEAKPDALLWLTDSQQTAAVAKVASRACGASIGARTDAGLIGGGSEYYGPPGDEARVAALAIQNAAPPASSTARPGGRTRRLGFASKRAAEQAPPLFLLAALPQTPDLTSMLAALHGQCRRSRKVGVVCSDRPS